MTKNIHLFRAPHVFLSICFLACVLLLLSGFGVVPSSEAEKTDLHQDYKTN
jgi:hypothetical protein